MISIFVFSVLLETGEEKLPKPLTYAGRSITRRRQSGKEPSLTAFTIEGEIFTCSNETSMQGLTGLLTNPNSTFLFMIPMPSAKSCSPHVNYVSINYFLLRPRTWCRASPRCLSLWTVFDPTNQFFHHTQDLVERIVRTPPWAI